MARLSAGAARAGREVGIHTATDVTGFGLLGHLIEVLEGSGLCAEIRLKDVPVLPGVRDLMKRRTVAALSARRSFPGATLLHSWFGQPPIPRGARENVSFQTIRVRIPPLLPEEDVLLLADPQTSGGLLLFVPEERAEALLRALESEGEGAWVIGRTQAMPGPEMHRVTVI